MRISLCERSNKNESLVKKIIDESSCCFYECTVHNIYYSVYQRMKKVLCQSIDEKDKKISHGDIVGECMKYIQKKDAQIDFSPLNDVNMLYRARIVYDYKKQPPTITKSRYSKYYNKMKSINSFLDKYIS